MYQGETHLFLTGERGVGKSTALQKALDDFTLPLTGFTTHPFRIAGHDAGHYIHSLSPRTPLAQNDKPIAVRIDQTGSFPIEESFRRFGCAYLRHALADDGLILLDELGRSEGRIEEFTGLVVQCLQARRVLGAMRAGNIEWLKTIAKRPDVCVLTVTGQNRGDIPSVVRQYLKGVVG